MVAQTILRLAVLPLAFISTSVMAAEVTKPEGYVSLVNCGAAKTAKLVVYAYYSTKGGTLSLVKLPLYVAEDLSQRFLAAGQEPQSKVNYAQDIQNAEADYAEVSAKLEARGCSPVSVQASVPVTKEEMATIEARARAPGEEMAIVEAQARLRVLHGL